MDLREAKVIADGNLHEAKAIAKGMVESSRIIADRMVESSRITADRMVKSSRIIADRNVESSRIIADRNAQTLLEGFNHIASSLSGTKAELMMDCLKMEANGDRLPKVGSKKWNDCRTYTQNIIYEFNGCGKQTKTMRRN